MAIQYCFRCKAKVTAKQMFTHVTNEGPARDYCKACWAEVNPDGTLETLQEKEARRGKRELWDSRPGLSGKRGTDRVQPDSERLRALRDAQNRKRKASSSVILRSSVQPAIDKHDARGSQSARSSLSGSRGHTARVTRRSDGNNAATIWISILGIVGIAIIIAILTRGGGDQGVEKTDDWTTAWNELTAREEDPNADPAMILESLLALESRAAGTEYETLIRQRIQIIEGILALQENAARSILKIATLHDQYKTLSAIDGVGQWKDRARGIWDEIRQQWHDSASERYSKDVVPLINDARKNRKYNDAFIAIDKFLAEVEQYPSAPTKWVDVVAEERKDLEGFRERNPEGGGTSSEWSMVTSADGFKGLICSPNGKWSVGDDGRIDIVSDSGDTWAILDVSAIERYDMELRLQVEEAESVIFVFRMAGNTFNPETDLHLQSNNLMLLDGSPHLLRFRFLQAGFIKIMIDGVDRTTDKLFYEEKNEGRFVLVFRGKTKASIITWRHKSAE